MEWVYPLAIPVLLALEAAAEVERWAHETRPDRHVRVFLASDAGILLGILALAGTGIGGLFWLHH